MLIRISLNGAIIPLWEISVNLSFEVSLYVRFVKAFIQCDVSGELQYVFVLHIHTIISSIYV